MTLPAAADREGCAVLELPISAPGLTVGQAIVGDDALDALEHDAHARRLAADAMRCAHDRGWVIVARGDLGGSVVCHAEAFFESMAAAERSAREIACPPGTVLEWSPGLTPDQYEPGGNLVPVPLADAQLPGPRFAPPGRELVVIDTDGLETLCASPDEALAHMRNLIEDLAVRLARQHPDQEELPAGMLANVDRVDGEIPPAACGSRSFMTRRPTRSMRSTCSGPTRCAGRASSARSRLPTGPIFPTRTSAARSPGGSRSKASTRPAGRPDAGEWRGSRTRLAR
jgi:hypothetical protein